MLDRGGVSMATGSGAALRVRPLAEDELGEADRIFRTAFATFIGMDPERFSQGRDFMRGRWRMDPGGVLAAETGGRVAGTNVVTTWGAFGYFGPLTVDPELWDAGIGGALVAAAMDLFQARGTRCQGLFTFAGSAKHIGLYSKFGFWPRFLTAIMTRAVSPQPPGARFDRLSAAAAEQSEAAMRACRELTDSLYEGLDLRREMASAREQSLGDTVLLWGPRRLDGFAVCHYGPGSEAPPGGLYVKFAAVRPGSGGAVRFHRLLDAIDALAAAARLETIEAGVNLVHETAARAMKARGFRTTIQGVAMQRPNAEGYKRPQYFVLDDWR
jgi:predicted N-acetyltransferase YhbS